MHRHLLMSVHVHSHRACKGPFSSHPPAPAGRDGAAEFRRARIPGAQYFDIDKVADTATSLPHMLPAEPQFAAAMDSLSISNDSQVVIYDGAGIFSAPRAWWAFKAFGHSR